MEVPSIEEAKALILQIIKEQRRADEEEAAKESLKRQIMTVFQKAGSSFVGEHHPRAAARLARRAYERYLGECDE